MNADLRPLDLRPLDLKQRAWDAAATVVDPGDAPNRGRGVGSGERSKNDARISAPDTPSMMA